jgi:aryl-alcohol dehydrogenase-like predicted oxidoreductase
MKYRPLGKTGLRVSEIGFGCGNIGGLMVRGSHEAQVSAVRHAVSLGINYFDTAANYGDGQSETNLGLVLDEVKPNVHVGTKFSLAADELGDIPGDIRRSLERSLQRLRRDSLDLLQLHNRVTHERGARGSSITIADVLGAGGVADTLDALKSEGLIRAAGFTGMGETPAINEVVASGRFNTVQTYFNMLNPSAGRVMPTVYPNQDYQGFMTKATENGMGVICIRVMAGGALAGPESREGVASETVAGAMADGHEYENDLRRVEALATLPLGELTLAQGAVRFALDHAAASVAMVGFTTGAQIDAAIAAVDTGPLSQETIAALEEMWARDFR